MSLGKKPALTDFLRLLFNDHESACYSPDIKGTRVYRRDHPPVGSRFVSLNPIHPARDFNPTQEYHSEFKPRRADANCTAYRTFLCEFDRISIDQQLEYIRAKRLPVSSLTFSGGKSIHALIVLDRDVDLALYQKTVKRIFRALQSEVDHANKNPSRLTRLPNAVRENGQTQTLLQLGGRIAWRDLDTWLEESGASAVDPTPDQATLPGFESGFSPSPYLSRGTQDFLSGDYEEGNWNIQLFRTCCELFKKGHCFDEVIAICKKITGHLDSKDTNTIRSAHRTVTASSGMERTSAKLGRAMG